MLRLLMAVLVLSASAYAFDEAGQLSGTVSRPGYHNLQVNQPASAGGNDLEDYIVYNRLANTPRLGLLQYQSSVSPVDGESYARDFIRQNLERKNVSAEDFRVVSSKLVLNRTHFINLVQTYRGLDIWGSYLSIKSNRGGRAFMYGGEIFANIELDPVPSITPEAARAAAISGIIYNPGTDLAENDGLLVLPLIFDEAIDYRLCYLFNVITFEPRADWRVFVDAHSGEVVWREDMIHYETVSGYVSGLIQPVTAFDPQQQEPFPNVYIYADGSWVVDSDQNGSFIFNVTGSDPVEITAYMRGPFLNVSNQIGMNAYFEDSVNPGGFLEMLWNDDNSTIPERDAFFHGQVVHDFIKSIDPDLMVLDFPMTCRINVDGSCNAYWSSYDRSINFFRAGGGCPNIAQLAEVVYHEYGHGLTNLQYRAGGSADPEGAMHEGFSDFISCLITDQSLLGRGFYGPGSHLRNLDNDNRYPEDWIGESHHDGLIIGGALWDLKLLIDTEEPGYVDTLWHFAKYGYSRDFLNYFWDLVAVDDDDGNIQNGTPHAYEIFHSFGDLHGIGPGVTVEITHTPLIDTEDSTSNYAAEANVYSMFSMDSGTVTIYYSTGGDFNAVEMTNVSGDDWYGEIPVQPFGSTIGYYIEAIDDVGLRSRSPEAAPDSVYSFYAGYDTIPPTMIFIKGQTNTIDLFGPYGPFAFEASDVHDIDSTSARIHVRLNNEDEIVLPMQPGTNQDEFVLNELVFGETLVTGDIIQYWFTCQDLAVNQNAARLPVSDAFSFEITTTELIDDFEEGIDDWTVINPGWIAYGSQGYQSTRSIKSSNGYYANNMNTIIYLSQPLNLSPYDEAWLSFMHLNYIRPEDTCYAVASNSPSGPWTRFGGITGNTAWIPEYVELAGFAGPGNQEVYIGLQFISDNAGTYIGILVDNVTVHTQSPTVVSDEKALPEEFTLAQNYPNPFNMNTVISFTMPQAQVVQLDIYDILGRKIIRLIDGYLSSGAHQVTWNGRNSGGSEVASGIYFYRLAYGERSEIRKMNLLK